MFSQKNYLSIRYKKDLLTVNAKTLKKLSQFLHIKGSKSQIRNEQ